MKSKSKSLQPQSLSALLVACLSLLLTPAAFAAPGAGASGAKTTGQTDTTGKTGKTDAAAPAVDAAALATKVQRFYESTTDFAADFEQNYRYRAMRRIQKSSGTVQVKKPGLMRWDYAKPYPKQFVMDGQALYVFDPEDNAVTVNREFSSDGLSAAVTFLWGRGNLADEFEIGVANRADYGTTVLELVPKKPQSGFTRLFFAVDAASGAVLTSVVIDSQGNENRITFKNVKTNTGIANERFRFEIPKGAVVQELK